MNTDQFVATVNDLRRHNKNKWYEFMNTVNGKSVRIKGYNTWLQIFTVNGLSCAGCMDITVKEFKEELSRGVN